MKRRKKMFLTGIAVSFILMMSLIEIFPLYWAFTMAFRPDADLFAHRLIPSSLTLNNFKILILSKSWGGFESVSFLVPLRNSLIVALGATVLAVSMSAFAGYALARFSLPGKGLISSYILFSYVFPPFILAIALYGMMQAAGLHDNLFGLILLHLLIVVPYCTWTLRGYFLNVPKDLEEAAMIDGCSRIGALFRVVLPVSAPGLASTAVFAFTLSWSDLLFALINIDSYKNFTLPIALRAMVIGDYVKWGSLMAGVIIAIIPPMVFYLLLQRYVVQGLAAGAIKG